MGSSFQEKMVSIVIVWFWGILQIHKLVLHFESFPKLSESSIKFFFYCFRSTGWNYAALKLLENSLSRCIIKARKFCCNTLNFFLDNKPYPLPPSNYNHLQQPYPHSPMTPHLPQLSSHPPVNKSQPPPCIFHLPPNTSDDPYPLILHSYSTISNNPAQPSDHLHTVPPTHPPINSNTRLQNNLHPPHPFVSFTGKFTGVKS